MTVALRLDRKWAADEFMVTDQEAFGNAWRYQLLYGQVVTPLRGFVSERRESSNGGA